MKVPKTEISRNPRKTQNNDQNDPNDNHRKIENKASKLEGFQLD